MVKTGGKMSEISWLQLAAKPKIKPAIVTIAGPGGVGKTTLAATWPNPIIVSCEEGAASVHNTEAVVTPKITESIHVVEVLRELLETEHNYKTVVLDTITELNNIIESEIVARDKKSTTINTAAGGYGAGFSLAASVHRQIHNICMELRDKKNMHVVYLAHTKTATKSPPDAEDYIAEEIDMNHRCYSVYVSNVDVVGWLRLRTMVSGEGKKRAVTTGERVLQCYTHPAHQGKNRYGISTDMVVQPGKNPLYNRIKQYYENGGKNE
jgi:hypothetical protein